MKKVNKKLAGAIVMGLMLAVPVGVSAATPPSQDGNVWTIYDLEKHNNTDGSYEDVVFKANIDDNDAKGNQAQIAFIHGDGVTKNITSTGTMKIEGNWKQGAFYVTDNGTSNISAVNIETTGTGNAHIFNAWEGTINVTAEENIKMEGSGVAFSANRAGSNGTDSKVIVSADSVIVATEVGIALKDGNQENGTSNVNITADTIDLTGSEYAIKAEHNTDGQGISQVDLIADTVSVDGKIYAENNKNMIVNVNANESAIINSDITAVGSNIDLNLGKGILTGTVVGDTESTVDMDMANGVWNVKGNSTVNNLTGEGAVKIDDAKNVTEVVIGSAAEGITYGNTAAVTDTFKTAEDAKKYFDMITVNGEKISTYTADAGAVFGEIEVSSDGTVKEGVNANNQGISEMASIGLMAWRAENNDMNKRLGELRNSNGEHGVWARMVRGESEYGAQSIKNVYNTYQLGYDEKLSTNDHWTVGAAISYTDAQSSFATGSGENTSKGLSFYGSYLGDNGEFVDLIAKYARLDNEFDVVGSGAGSGDYSTNGYSFSAEFGKRNELANDFYFEPQVELTYGRVADVDYVTSKEVKVSQDSMDSLVGRVGFAAGKNIKNGNVYVRASYLYDFDGETSVTFAKGNSAPRTFEEDLGGGWFEFGIGTNINLSDATYLYLDVEKTTGGEVDTNWQWNAGVRYSF